MTTIILISVLALIFGVGVGLLNSKITVKVMGKEVSVQRVMAVNILHIVISFAYLALVLLATKIFKTGSTYPLIVGAAGLVATPVIVAVFRKSS